MLYYFTYIYNLKKFKKQMNKYNKKKNRVIDTENKLPERRQLKGAREERNS